LSAGDHVDDDVALLGDLAAGGAVRAIGAGLGHLAGDVAGGAVALEDLPAGLVARGQSLHPSTLDVALADLVERVRHRCVLLWTGAVRALL